MSGPRIVFCSRNHIYDASLYDECPYCSKEFFAPPVFGAFEKQADFFAPGEDAPADAVSLEYTEGTGDAEEPEEAGSSENDFADEDLPGIKIPFFTKDGVPDPRNIDASMGLAEGMNGTSSGSGEVSAKKEEVPAGEREEPAAGDAAEFDEEASEEDIWENSPLKNEGSVRGWFVFRNGLQKDHSVELCKRSMFIYDYDGMCLVLSARMENMTLLATIEQYKSVSIIPEAGVPFEVNGEPRRSCGKLGDYMRLLIGSHRMIYISVDDRLLNGE